MQAVRKSTNGAEQRRDEHVGYLTAIKPWATQADPDTTPQQQIAIRKSKTESTAATPVLKQVSETGNKQ